MTEILRRFGADVRAIYSVRGVAWQALAAVLTYVLVVSGFDWWWFANTRDPLLQSWLFPAAIVGFLIPILLPIALLFVGRARERAAAFAVAKAAFLGLAISSLYKVFTGRIPPPFRSETLIDISRQFDFGFFRQGAFNGWPSSHTTVAFAVAVTLFVIYRDRPLVRYGALLLAFYIGIGISTNIHWLSDFVAGAIIGAVIGSVIGRRIARAK